MLSADKRWATCRVYILCCESGLSEEGVAELPIICSSEVALDAQLPQLRTTPAALQCEYPTFGVLALSPSTSDFNVLVHVHVLYFTT